MQKVGLAKGHLGLNDLKKSMGLDRCKALVHFRESFLMVGWVEEQQLLLLLLLLWQQS
jgi:hypothetical protein